MSNHQTAPAILATDEKAAREVWWPLRSFQTLGQRASGVQASWKLSAANPSNITGHLTLLGSKFCSPFNF